MSSTQVCPFCKATNRVAGAYGCPNSTRQVEGKAVPWQVPCIGCGRRFAPTADGQPVKWEGRNHDGQK